MNFGVKSKIGLLIFCILGLVVFVMLKSLC